MTEQRLRDLFEFDAARAPRAVGLASAARRRNRRRTKRLALGVAAVVVVGMSAGAAWLQPEAVKPSATNRPVAADPTGARQGPLPEDGAASCVEAYSPEAVARRAFAFDGTVVEIGPPRSDRPGVELALAGVTFRVNQWFRGGTGMTVVIDLPINKAYEIGTRLLVSGEPRWGGEPTAAAIAWGCGFTRYYDPGTAAQWAR